MKDHRQYNLTDKSGRPLGNSVTGPTFQDRLRRLWTPRMKIRVTFLAICAFYFLRYGIGKGTGLVALVAGLMLLVAWFLSSLKRAVVAARRKSRSAAQANCHPYLPLAVSGLLLAATTVTAWNEIRHYYVFLSAGVGAVFFLLSALTEPMLRKRTG